MTTIANETTLRQCDADAEALKVADVLAMQARLMLDETRDAQKREFEGIVMKLCRKYAALRAGLKPVEKVF